ncbi:hypothetical protein WJX72_008951 [[Myrmecia] bisecta]|uniref:Uncharacterized protein n=1 Tax=[Myrmecia] bisecta TaxID=41462 RepID=A0AAW1R8V4_9CHLO
MVGATLQLAAALLPTGREHPSVQTPHVASFFNTSACKPAASRLRGSLLPSIVKAHRARQQLQCRVGREDEDVVEGFNITEGSLFESEAAGAGLKILFALLCLGAVSGMVFLARPVINYVIEAFPGQ